MTELFVTGATGFVGRAFLAALRDQQGPVDVTTFGRRAPADGSHRWIKGDITDAASICGLPAGGTVIHIAAEKRDPLEMARVNVEGTRMLLRAAAAAAVHRFVLLSSVGVYGAPPGSGRVTEAYTPRAANEYERTKLAAQQETLGACAAEGMQCVVLQPSNVIGVTDGKSQPLLGLMRAVRRGSVIRFSRDARANYVSVHDVAESLALAARGSVPDGTYIVNEPMPLDDFLDAVAHVVGSAPPRRRLPAVVGRGAGAVGSVAERVLRRSLPVNRPRMRELTNSTWYDPTALRERAGFRYRVGVAKTLAEMASAYAAVGAL